MGQETGALAEAEGHERGEGAGGAGGARANGAEPRA